MTLEHIKSPTIGKLAEALSKAQGTFDVAKKNCKNPHFNSTYADFTSIVESVKNSLSGNGLSFVQLPVTGPDGAIWLRTVLMHSSGEWISGDYPIKPERMGPQSLASAITYARRNSIASVLGIPAEDDDDGNAATHPSTSKSPQEVAQSLGPKYFDSSNASSTRRLDTYLLQKGLPAGHRAEVIKRMHGKLPGDLEQVLNEVNGQTATPMQDNTEYVD